MPAEYKNTLTDLVKRIRPLLVNVALGTCRVVEQSTGWYISAGSSSTRYMEHGASFRLDSEGNARGNKAVDLQTSRAAATQVASGATSFVGGGATNTASGDSSATLGGDTNLAQEENSVAMGWGGKTNSRFQLAYGQNISAVGDAQRGEYACSASVLHDDANWYPIVLGNVDGVTVPTDTTMTFRALVAGVTQGAAKSFSFEIVGHVENDGGTTTLKTSTVTTIDDSDDTSFDCRAQANDTDDTLEIQIQDSDGASDTVIWTASVETAEATFAA